MMILTILLKLVAGSALMLLALLLALLFDGVDRIINARMQRRWGPPLFQPFYDILKLLGKENIVPRRAIAWIFNSAPWMALASMLVVFLYMPVGSLPAILGGEGDLVLILYMLGFCGVCMALGGFASSNPIANVGAQREMILMMSYELPLAVVASTMAWVAYRYGLPGEAWNLETFVANPVWNVVGKAGILGLLCLLFAMVLVVPGETGKGLMDIPEAKTEILEGLIIEYSGVNLAMLKLTFALRALAISAIITVLFFPLSLGKLIGFSGCFLYALDFLWFWVKVFVVQIVVVTFMRSSLGRLKIGQASHFYWVNVAGLSIAGMLLLSIDRIF